MRIEVDSETLSKRGSRVQELLRPIARRSEGPAWKPHSIPRTYIIGTYDGGRPASSDYRNWRFDTPVKSFRAMYFELWKELDRFWYLDRAYLSIFEHLRNSGEREYICLHCDPNEADSEAHSIYKQGPHLHVKAAEEPLPHAHIALARSNLTQVLLSDTNLTDAMALAIEMLRDQVLDELAKM